jgi:hypothetical protein
VIALLVRGVALAGIYLLVLTSLAPGDILVGGAIGVAVAYSRRPLLPRQAREPGHRRDPAR